MENEDWLKQCNYDPITGIVTYKNGLIADKVERHGYIYFNFVGQRWKAHRVAWRLVHGRWPEIIDHINGDRKDNRLVNLRECLRSENSYNCRAKSPRTGYRGVTHVPGKRFRAAITINRKRKHLGYFDTAEEAALAYNTALKEIDPLARPNVISTPSTKSGVLILRDDLIWLLDRVTIGTSDAAKERCDRLRAELEAK